MTQQLRPDEKPTFKFNFVQNDINSSKSSVCFPGNTTKLAIISVQLTEKMNYKPTTIIPSEHRQFFLWLTSREEKKRERERENIWDQNDQQLKKKKSQHLE